MNNTYDSKLPTGFTPIDEVIEGFHYGNLVTLAGRPCMRTEYFSYTMMRNWIQNDMIDEALSYRDYTMPILAIGLPSSSAFGNRLLLKFAKSTAEEDITWRFYTHYIPLCLNVTNIRNIDLRRHLIKHLYGYFYNDRFKKRIEGSKLFNLL